MRFSNTPDYRGGTEIGLNAGLIGFSTLLYGLRLFVRISMTKSPGWDDAIAGIAYILLMLLSAADIHGGYSTHDWSVSKSYDVDSITGVSFGSGAHQAFIPEDVLTKFTRTLMVQTLLYFWVVAMVRFAILAFLPRLARDRYISRTSWVVAVVIIAQTITAFVYRLTECTPLVDDFLPIDEQGTHCVGTVAHNKMMVGHGVVGIAVDAILLFLPIWVICTKMMWSRKTLQIILILSVGVFAVATGIIRVALMETRDFSADITYQMPSLGIWTNLEGHVGLWCGCFPALQPILRVVPDKLKVHSTMSNNGNQADDIGGNIGTKKLVYEGSREHFKEVDSESQRAIILTEMGSSELLMRERDISPV
ncbi:hypothetical protein F5Y05DRAFT_320236 [Hypoxylon sp. FL0543]|nr:hypothetical protein F5Y05DRAFT_320236 [Hypoxylon sp. FL0543]